MHSNRQSCLVNVCLEVKMHMKGGPAGFHLCVTGTVSKSSQSMSSQDEALRDVVLSPDLPLEAIAEEMQNTWHLKVSKHGPGLEICHVQQVARTALFMLLLDPAGPA